MPKERVHLIKIYAALVLVYIGGEILVANLPIRSYQTRVEILTDYQVERAGRLTGGEVVLLGDSSLGNAIDERLLSDLSGVRCRNLALVAFFGPRGDELLLEHILRNSDSDPPRALVLFHSPTNWTHPGLDGSVAQLIDAVDPPPLDWVAKHTFRRLPSVERSRSYKSIFFAARTGLRYDTSVYDMRVAAEGPAAAAISARGYMGQGTRVELSPENPGSFGKFAPVVSARENLQRLFSIAGDHGIDVFLAVGPHWGGRIGASSAYLADLKSWLLETTGGFDHVRFLYGRVPEAPAPFIGDSQEHLNDRGRNQFTRWFASILQQRLAGESGNPPLEWVLPAEDAQTTTDR